MGLQVARLRRRRRPATTSGTASRSSAGSGSRTSRSASTGMPAWGEPAGGRGAGDRRDLRRRTDLVALRAQRPQARRPALRLQARLAGPAARGRRAAGWTATPRWSATGTSPRRTRTSSTWQQFANVTHVTPAGAGRVPGLPRRRVRRRGAPAHARPGVYTYWDYYRQRFERNRGLRDRLRPRLAARWPPGSPAPSSTATSAPGTGASDHAPVVVDLD